MKNKRGELTTQQIVMLIILIVSFAIVLVFIFLLNPGGITNKEICHNSVVMKGKSGSLVSELDCKTSYVCISAGQDCEGFNPTETVELKLEGDGKDEERIMGVIAEEMADCWWMFAEGTVNFGTAQGWSLKCAVCSVIKFDPKIIQWYPEISYQKFYKYLEREKINKEKTYLNYLYNIFKITDYDNQGYFDIDLNSDVISTSKKYSIITGIDDNITPWSDALLKVNLISTQEVSSRTTCDDFLTRA